MRKKRCGKIRIKDIIFYGKTKQEKLLNIVLLIVALIAVASAGLVFIMSPPTKFYSIVFFNFVFLAGLLHLRVKYLVQEEKYRKLEKDLREAGLKEEEVRQYLLDKKEWEIYSSWLIMVIMMAALMLFVYWLIP